MGLLDTVLFAWADGGEFHRSFVHKGFCVPQFIGMWYELRAKRMREDRICAKYRLYQRYHSLVFGNESSGLPDEYLNYGQSIFIPHSHHIDSLNLSMALGITLAHFSKDEFKDKKVL